MKISGIAIVLMSLALVGSADARARNSFDRVMSSYEPIRLALAENSLEDVSENAEEIVQELQHLRRNITAAEAGVELGEGMIIFSELEKWTATAQQLQKADSTAEARIAFEELSVAMIDWRGRQVRSSKTIVAHCPLTDETWLQAKKSRKEIKNPYSCSSPEKCKKLTNS